MLTPGAQGPELEPEPWLELGLLLHQQTPGSLTVYTLSLEMVMPFDIMHTFIQCVNMDLSILVISGFLSIPVLCLCM